MLHRAATRLRDERGFTLVELLTTASLLSVVLGAVTLFGGTAHSVTPRDQERALVITEARAGLHRMTRELRQSYAVHASSALQIEVSVNSGGVATRVRYECDQAHPTEATYRRCVRYPIVGGVTQAGEVVIDRVLNTSSIFTYTTNVGVVDYTSTPVVNHVQVALDVPARGDRKAGFGNAHKVALYDGFYLRNLNG